MTEMDREKQLARLEFTERFGISPQKCKEVMEQVANIINSEVQEVIEHADYYIDPLAYCSKEHLEEEFGEDALEKDDDADGYPNLYDYRKSHSAEMLFKHLISWHTHYGGHTTAIEACKLMDIGEGWRE